MCQTRVSRQAPTGEHDVFSAGLPGESRFLPVLFSTEHIVKVEPYMYNDRFSQELP